MNPTGIGLGLRGAFIRRVDKGEADGRVAFLEIAPENYMRRGGMSPQRLARIAERFDIITHGLMMSLGGTDPLDPEYLGLVRSLIGQVNSPWHSDHLCWSGIEQTCLHDLLPIPFTRDVAKRVAERVNRAQDALGTTMAVENISWYLQLGHSDFGTDALAAETEFICEVLDRADCKLLLDVNNVYVNAVNHGFESFAWLERIPLERVVQLHIAGHEPWDETLLVDTHGATVRNEVIAMLAWVIERIGPMPVLLERDSNIPDLTELLDEVSQLDRVYQSALQRYESRRTR